MGKRNNSITEFYSMIDSIEDGSSKLFRKSFKKHIEKKTKPEDIITPAEKLKLVLLPNSRSYSNFLIGALTWKDTEQGHDFWSKIYLKLYRTKRRKLDEN